MIRKATFDDIDLIEATYNEHFKYETEHEAFTVFKKEIYPTRKDAEKAVDTGTLYVYEENGNIAGSMIMDKSQPIEYTKISWQNIPAVSLYKKLGFKIVATASMKVGNAIEHREHLFLEKRLS